jgi:outer membrane lipoprotein SlyB
MIPASSSPFVVPHPSRRQLASLVLALSITGLTGCVTPAKEGIVVDTKGVDPVGYQRDLDECGEYADSVSTGKRTAVGAAAGATIWGAIGAIFDGSDGAEKGAGAGAVLGGARGASSGYSEKQQIVRNCLRGRGYRVLN